MSVTDPDHLSLDVPVTPALYRQFMRILASGVVVITAAHAGRRHCMTATAATSVAADPATLLVSVHRSARCHDMITDSRSFAVNVLAENQSALGLHFANAPGDRFAGISYRTGRNDIPFLEGLS